MIGWSIEAAFRSAVFDRVIVSTDDEEIASVAKEFDAEIPFVRPAELSDDYSTTFSVVRHAIHELEESDADICCLYPTAPFVTAQALCDSYDILSRNQCEFVLAVTAYPYPIGRALRIRERDQRLELLSPEAHSTRSQELVEAYHDAGQFCWGTAEAFTTRPSVMQSDLMPLILPPYRVQDIDSEENWIRAELMMSAIQQMA